jgi:sarcosine oxidase, subunit delta
MKILTCPVNGPRPVSEFAFGGEVRPMPDAATCSDGEWADYVFNRSGTWFFAERDTVADRVIRTWLPGEAVP